MSAFGQAWIDLTIVALLLIAPFGALTGKRMRAIRHAVTDATTIEPELAGQLEDTFLKASLGLRIFSFLGIVLLMAAKPELLQSALIVASSALLSLLSLLVFWRRRAPLSTPGTKLASSWTRDHPAVRQRILDTARDHLLKSL